MRPALSTARHFCDDGGMVAEAGAREVTLALARLAGGDKTAARELLPLVYAELRVLASRRLAKLPPGQTLQPTALVHEAYVELVGKGDPGWNGRGHFFGAAARAMHDILVDQARKKGAVKRGAGARATSLDESVVAQAAESDPAELLAISAALEKLRDAHARQAEVAMLRTFAGLTEAEIAEMHGTTARTVERDWRFAQAFLLRELSR